MFAMRCPVKIGDIGIVNTIPFLVEEISGRYIILRDRFGRIKRTVDMVSRGVMSFGGVVGAPR